jgi:hypothetical protein
MNHDRKTYLTAGLTAVVVAIVAFGPCNKVQTLKAIDLRAPDASKGTIVYPMLYNSRSFWLAQSYYRRAGDGALEFLYRKNQDSQWRFNPVSTSLFCLASYNEYVQTHAQALRSDVLKIAGALTARSEKTNGGMLWRYGFPHSTLGIGSGWISSMAQGGAMGCFGAAYLLDHRATYAEAARRSFATLTAPFGENGTATRVGRGTFYEEVAGVGGKPAHILNGMISALAGLWFANKALPRPEYAKALDAGIRAVRFSIDQYVAPSDSLYDQATRGMARLRYGYNLVHVSQLQWLYDITGDIHFLTTAAKFLSFERRIDYKLMQINDDGTSSTAKRVDGRGRFAGRLGQPVTLVASLEQPTVVDRVDFIATNEAQAPALVHVTVKDERRELRPTAKFVVARFEPVRTTQVRLELVPKTGSRIGITLLTLSNPQIRSLTALSSDVQAYWQRPSDAEDAAPTRSPLNLYDGSTSTVWSVPQPNGWLFVDLGDAGYRSLTIEPCASKPGPQSVMFSTNGRTWTPSISLRSDLVERERIPKGVRYVLLRWKSPGCLSELSGS